MKTVEQRTSELHSRRDLLKARMAEIDSELDSHESKDWEDMATEREQDEVLEDLGNSAGEELRMIEAALSRVAEGEYGFCVKCGTQISEERLDVLPATPFCRNCAS